MNVKEKVIKNVIRITLVSQMHIVHCINNIHFMVNKYITIISMYLLFNANKYYTGYSIKMKQLYYK